MDGVGLMRNFDLSKEESLYKQELLAYDIQCLLQKEKEADARKLYEEWQNAAIESYERATVYEGDHSSYDDALPLPKPESPVVRKKRAKKRKKGIDDRLRSCEEDLIAMYEAEGLTWHQAIRLTSRVLSTLKRKKEENKPKIESAKVKKK